MYLFQKDILKKTLAQDPTSPQLQLTYSTKIPYFYKGLSFPPPPQCAPSFQAPKKNSSLNCSHMNSSLSPPSPLPT